MGKKGFVATPKMTQNINQAGSWERKMASGKGKGRNIICVQQEGLWAAEWELPYSLKSVTGERAAPQVNTWLSSPAGSM